MFIPFFGNSIDIKLEGDIYRVRGNLGFSTKSLFRKSLGHESKFLSLFKDYSSTGFEFYSFFKPEIVTLLTDIVSKGSLGYSTNIKVLKSILEWFKEEETKLKRNFEIDYKAIDDSLEFKILPHQKPVFERFEVFKRDLGYRGMLVDADPGTGKTFTSLALAEGCHSEKVIIICPLNTVSEVWLPSIAGEPGKLVFKKPQDFYSMRDGGPYRNEKYIIAHYESLDKLFNILKDRNFNKNVPISVIVDESHNLAAEDSKRTKLAIEITNFLLTKDEDNIFLLSGTPLKSSFRELGNISKFLDKRFTGNVEKRFYKLYKSPNKFLSDLLTSRYTGYSIKVKKDSIGLEEPITQYINVKLKNGDEYTLDTIRVKLKEFVSRRTSELMKLASFYHEEYQTLLKTALDRAGSNIKPREISIYQADFERIRRARGDIFYMGDVIKEVNAFEAKLKTYLQGEEKKRWQDAKTIVKYPHLKIQGEALGQVITGARIKCHEDIARALNYGEILNSTVKKTVIFSSYNNVCLGAMEKSRSEGFKPIGVFGDTTRDLNKNVTAWTKDEKVNPLVATYKSLSTGVPLIAGNIVICLDLPFRMYVYNQAISRVWRLGQDLQVYIYILSLDTGEKPNINSRNIDIIKFFNSEIEKITGYKSNLDLEGEIASEIEGFIDLSDGRNKISLEERRELPIFNLWR